MSGVRAIPSTPRTPRAALALAASVVLLVPTACSPSDPVGEESGLTWITMPMDGAGDAALTQGKIADLGGCMVLEPRILASDMPADPLHLVFEDTDDRPESYAVGDEVELGGSGEPAAEAGGERDAGRLHVPEECAGAETLWYVAPEGF